MQPKFKLNTAEFNRTLKQYAGYSKREVTVILNTKAFFIARRAVIETPKTNKGKIGKELGRVIRTGKRAGQLVLKKARDFAVPLAALIINKRLGPGHGLEGAAMAEAIKKLLGARLRSIAFLKSGWLPAIKKLEPLAEKRGAPRQDKTPTQFGQAKGFAKPAGEGWRASCVIANLADARRDAKEALIKYGGPALQRAFDFETASMRKYIEDKLRAAAKRAGIRTN